MLLECFGEDEDVVEVVEEVDPFHSAEHDVHEAGEDGRGSLQAEGEDEPLEEAKGSGKGSDLLIIGMEWDVPVSTADVEGGEELALTKHREGIVLACDGIDVIDELFVSVTIVDTEAVFATFLLDDVRQGGEGRAAGANESVLSEVLGGFDEDVAIVVVGRAWLKIDNGIGVFQDESGTIPSSATR